MILWIVLLPIYLDIIIPVDAVKTSIRVIFYLLNHLGLSYIGRIKQGIVFLCTLMIVEDRLKVLVTTLCYQSYNPLYVLRIFLLGFLEEAFKSEGQSEVVCIQIEFVQLRVVVGQIKLSHVRIGS